MSDPIFMFEEFFELGFQSESYEVKFLVGDKATLLTASLWHDNRSDDRREQGRLVVKTRGYVAKFNQRATAIVVRRVGSVVRLPDNVGRFVAEFASKYAFHHWLVFEKSPFLEPRVASVPPPPAREAPPASRPQAPSTPRPTPSSVVVPGAGTGAPPGQPGAGFDGWQFPDID